MIYDTIENAAIYSGISPRLTHALRYLQETDFSKVADGRYELDGDDLFANVMTYTTKEGNDTPEAHRAYLDVQFLISGAEHIAVGRLSDTTGVAEEHPERDVWVYYGATEDLTLGDGRFLVVWPQDVHAPGRAIGAPETVRKCVVKVRI